MTGKTNLPKQSRRRLGLRHAVHVQAAEYWLTLGEMEEAEKELQRIQFSRRRHPDVERMRQQIRERLATRQAGQTLSSASNKALR